MQLGYYGSVTINGANSENANFSIWTTLPAGGCPVSGTLDFALEVVYPTGFTFTALGLNGHPGTGFMDTGFTPPAAGTFTGVIYKYGQCGAPFSAPAPVAPPSKKGPYEYFGGGSVTVNSNDAYIVEIYH